MEKHDEANLDRWVGERLETLTPDSRWEPSVPHGLARLRGRHDSRILGRRSSFWIVAAAAAALVVTMAAPSARAFAERCGEFVLRSLSGSGPSREYARAAKRRAMPDFTLNDAAGQPFTLSTLRGHVVLINFWTTSCAQCEVEIPWFTEFQRTYRPRGFAVIGVSLDKDGWTSVTPYLDERKIDYRVVLGNDDIARLRGGRGSIPTTLIIDKLGRIAVTHVGFCSKREYDADIRSVLAEN